MDRGYAYKVNKRLIFLFLSVVIINIKVKAQIYTENSSDGSITITPKGLRGKENNLNNVNLGLGSNILSSNTDGINNIGIGFYALTRNTTGNNNVGIGRLALYSNTVGKENVAIGNSSLGVNTTGGQNTAVGYNSLYANSTGYQNTVIGSWALVNNSSGYYNTASGNGALFYNTTGYRNSAIGHQSLFANTTGNNNIAIGTGSGSFITIGNNNVFLGDNANTTVNNINNSIAIGANTTVDASNKIRLGNSNITVIEGQVAYSYPSDGRFKNNIKEDIKGLDFITRLRPVSYNFDTQAFDKFTNGDESSQEADFSFSKSIKHSGFIAQEVEKAMIETGYDFDGITIPKDKNQTYSLSYSQFVVPLVKAVQEQQVMIEVLKEETKQLLNLITDLKNQLKK
ncbi:tail fiber domain-containing protein [Emticicia sp. BO119]|uniref:tail fiber domain-containing protein n=1 Tax=Emticicia sp. BO119 TaxID=2757768 RepID=UPI0017AAD9A8|nr:tail fiber domain-containing protein [Emticicia sp. BO119]MBA4850197.1 tail fiber domain-containing protein [Emticicia sp. BO119]